MPTLYVLVQFSFVCKSSSAIFNRANEALFWHIVQEQINQ